MKELAALCKVSVATVSYALRDDPRITEAVRKRIQQSAKKYGYYNDSLAQSLVAYRTQPKGRERYRHIAILYPNRAKSRQTRLFQPHKESIVQTLAQYGYEIAEYFLPEVEVRPYVFSQQLMSEGIRGIILAWGQWGQVPQDFSWEHFTVVSAERNEVHPAFDRVSLNHFRATATVYQRIFALGGKRIGLVCHSDLPYRVKKNIIGAYYTACDASKTGTQDIEPYFYSLNEPGDNFSSWLNAYHPDAIMSHRSIPLDFYRACGVAIPGVPYGVIELDEGTDIESGVRVSNELGRVIADKIVGKLYYNETVDLSSEGTITPVEGVWHKGTTLITGKGQ